MTYYPPEFEYHRHTRNLPCYPPEYSRHVHRSHRRYFYPEPRALPCPYSINIETPSPAPRQEESPYQRNRPYDIHHTLPKYPRTSQRDHVHREPSHARIASEEEEPPHKKRRIRRTEAIPHRFRMRSLWRYEHLIASRSATGQWIVFEGFNDHLWWKENNCYVKDGENPHRTRNHRHSRLRRSRSRASHSHRSHDRPSRSRSRHSRSGSHHSRTRHSRSGSNHCRTRHSRSGSHHSRSGSHHSRTRHSRSVSHHSRRSRSSHFHSIKESMSRSPTPKKCPTTRASHEHSSHSQPDRHRHKRHMAAANVITNNNAKQSANANDIINKNKQTSIKANQENNDSVRQQLQMIREMLQKRTHTISDHDANNANAAKDRNVPRNTKNIISGLGTSVQPQLTSDSSGDDDDSKDYLKQVVNNPHPFGSNAKVIFMNMKPLEPFCVESATILRSIDNNDDLDKTYKLKFIVDTDTSFTDFVQNLERYHVTPKVISFIAGKHLKCIRYIVYRKKINELTEESQNSKRIKLFHAKDTVYLQDLFQQMTDFISFIWYIEDNVVHYTNTNMKYTHQKLDTLQHNDLRLLAYHKHPHSIVRRLQYMKKRESRYQIYPSQISVNAGAPQIKPSPSHYNLRSRSGRSRITQNRDTHQEEETTVTTPSNPSEHKVTDVAIPPKPSQPNEPNESKVTDVAIPPKPSQPNEHNGTNHEIQEEKNELLPNTDTPGLDLTEESEPDSSAESVKKQDKPVLEHPAVPAVEDPPEANDPNTKVAGSGDVHQVGPEEQAQNVMNHNGDDTNDNNK